MVLISRKDWDEWNEVRKLIGETSEVSRLYRSLGYSSSLDHKTEQILSKLKALVRIEIPDYSLFQEYVARVQGDIEKYKRGEFYVPDEVIDPKSRTFG